MLLHQLMQRASIVGGYLPLIGRYQSFPIKFIHRSNHGVKLSGQLVFTTRRPVEEGPEEMTALLDLDVR